MPKQGTVYVSLPTGWAYGREILRGVRSYASGHPGWRVIPLDLSINSIEQFASTQQPAGTGLIGAVAFGNMPHALQRSSVPVVNISSYADCPAITGVLADNLAIGRTAGDYFLELGYRRFAFVGLLSHLYARQRRDGLAEAMKKGGVRGEPLLEFDVSQNSITSPAVAPWLKALPPETAMLCSNDSQASAVLGLCQAAKIKVPEQLAVMGVDNDPLMCELGQVTLSSVDADWQRVGYEAAVALARLLRGEKRPMQPILVPPIGVVPRMSTTRVAQADADVAAARRMIQEHACDALGIPDILERVKVRRRTLERRFRQVTGRSLHDEIRRVQIERAKHLLATTQLTISQVSQMCGFGCPARFSFVFRSEVGATARDFRRDVAVPESAGG